MILKASHSAISLPESVDGHLHCDSQDGLMTDRSGPDRVRANLSARQAKEKGLLMSGTYGPRGSISLNNTSLQQSLESRLTQQLNTAGSTLFKLTWKPLVTPSGIRSFLLRASVLRTEDIDYGSWPTSSSSRDWKDSPGMVVEATNPDGSSRIRTDQLPRKAQLASWNTPTCPVKTDGHQAGNNRFVTSIAEALSPWSTARANKRGFPDSHGSDERPLDSGLMPIGYRAAMESGGPLNPEFSRWLMGYPREWTNCADLAMQSFRKSPRNSSKRSEK